METKRSLSTNACWGLCRWQAAPPSAAPALPALQSYVAAADAAPTAPQT